MMDGKKIEYRTNIADGAVYSRFDQSVCIIEDTNEIKGVIFDFDDTLYSEEEYVKSGYKVVSDYLGGNYENKLWDLFKSGRQVIDAKMIKNRFRQYTPQK